MDAARTGLKTRLTKRDIKDTIWRDVLNRDFARNKALYLMVAPVVLIYVVFSYIPLFGAVLAFQEYSPGNGFLAGPWVGFQQFTDFFANIYFFRVIKNTFLISLTTLVFEFPMPIILALMLNEVAGKKFKSLVQSITYLPYFISMVVICGMIIDFTRDTGLVSLLAGYFGFPRQTMLQKPELFRGIYVVSEIWQKAGYASIIYLAALTGIDPQLYDASRVDGAGKWRQLLHITIPGIQSTIIIMLILRMGNVLNVGFEKILLLYNPVIYVTSDVISTFVYRSGIEEMSFSFSTAVDLFNAAINFTFLIAANWVSRRVTSNSLW